MEHPAGRARLVRQIGYLSEIAHPADNHALLLVSRMADGAEPSRTAGAEPHAKWENTRLTGSRTDRQVIAQSGRGRNSVRDRSSLRRPSRAEIESLFIEQQAADGARR